MTSARLWKLGRGRTGSLLTLLLLLALVSGLLPISSILAAFPRPEAGSQAQQAAPAASASAAPAAAIAPTGSGPDAPLAPTIAATKNDTLAIDNNGNGLASPGDTLTYTVAITNSGTDATGVAFNDTLDSHTTLVPGSVNVSPLAFDDSYSTVGNTLLAVGVTPPSTPPQYRSPGVRRVTTSSSWAIPSR